MNCLSPSLCCPGLADEPATPEVSYASCSAEARPWRTHQRPNQKFWAKDKTSCHRLRLIASLLARSSLLPAPRLLGRHTRCTPCTMESRVPSGRRGCSGQGRDFRASATSKIAERRLRRAAPRAFRIAEFLLRALFASNNLKRRTLPKSCHVS